jgi:transcriptional regulator with XRE-family HTH domain
MATAKNPFLVDKYKDQLKELGNRIKMARQAKGMTQGEIADMIGVSSKTVSAIEVARVEPSISQMQAIAAVLEEPLGYFTGEGPSTVESKLDRVTEELKQIESLVEIIRAKGK